MDSTYSHSLEEAWIRAIHIPGEPTAGDAVEYLINVGMVLAAVARCHVIELQQDTVVLLHIVCLVEYMCVLDPQMACTALAQLA